jgi:hypothetical protein
MNQPGKTSTIDWSGDPRQGARLCQTQRKPTCVGFLDLPHVQAAGSFFACGPPSDASNGKSRHYQSIGRSKNPTSINKSQRSP